MEPELADLLSVIKKRLALILAATLAAAAVAGGISFYVLEPEYEATASLIVKNSGNEGAVDYNELIAQQKLVVTYAEIMQSRKIAQDVIRRIGSDETPEQLLSKVRIGANSESLITFVTVTDRDAAYAVQAANAFVHSFKDHLLEIFNSNNVTVLDEAALSADPRPVRPRPFWNMAVTFTVTLVLVVGGAFLAELLDKTVKTDAELQKLIGAPVLVSVPKFKPNRAVERGRRR